MTADEESVRREALVRGRLNEALERIRRELRSESSFSSLPETGNTGKDSSPKDTLRKSLDSIIGDVETLAKNVEKFEGPHFTRIYRTLQGDCAKLQVDLDGLDVTGRDDIRKDRKTQLVRIDRLAKELAKKTHAIACDKCEVRE